VSAELLERWSPRTADALGRIDRVVDRVAARLGTEALAQARADAGHPHLASRIRLERTGHGFAVTSSHPAQASRERGGPIRGTPYLAVPLTDAVRRAASGPRQDGRLFVLRIGGRPFLARRRPGGELEVRWRLIDQVLATHRPALGPAMRRAASRLPGELGDAVAEALRG
jgi:hypothetical protein